MQGFISPHTAALIILLLYRNLNLRFLAIKRLDRNDCRPLLEAFYLTGRRYGCHFLVAGRIRHLVACRIFGQFRLDLVSFPSLHGRLPGIQGDFAWRSLNGNGAGSFFAVCRSCDFSRAFLLGRHDALRINRSNTGFAGGPFYLTVCGVGGLYSGFQGKLLFYT